jgi:hypothetical protein
MLLPTSLSYHACRARQHGFPLPRHMRFVDMASRLGDFTKIRLFPLLFRDDSVKFDALVSVRRDEPRMLGSIEAAYTSSTPLSSLPRTRSMTDSISSPMILPFRRPEPPADDHALILRKWKSWVVCGRPVYVMIDRREAAAYPLVPRGFEHDPSHPGEIVSIRLLDVTTGEEITPASDEELWASLSVQSRPRRVD